MRLPTILSRHHATALLLASLGGLFQELHAQSKPVAGDIPKSMRQVSGITLGVDSLASVNSKLGQAVEWHTGDAAESEWHWCYQIGASPQIIVLMFESDGEMGTAGHSVQTIRVVRAAQSGVDLHRCAQMRSNAPPRTPGGLRLGLSRTAVQALLGTPVRAHGDSLVYVWEAKELIPKTAATYSYWNSRRKECYGGDEPFSWLYAQITVRIDKSGIYEFILGRSDNATC